MSFAATSLPDALCQMLRISPPVVAAFGDTYNPALSILANQTAGNVSKFWSDYADQVPQPYLVFEADDESYDFMTHVQVGSKPFIAEGAIICRIIQSGRTAARALGIQVCNALNDCDVQSISWSGFGITSCVLMQFRMARATWAPDPEIGPSVPTTFNRIIPCSYTYQGAI